MQTRAVAKYVRMSPRKVRLVTNLIKGKDLEEAKEILDYCPKAAARVVAKVLASAAANAENNNRIPPERLYVLNAFVDEGPTLKRFRARALGRATRINKRTSHITVILEEREEERPRRGSALRRISRRPAVRKIAGPRKGKKEKVEELTEKEIERSKEDEEKEDTTAETEGATGVEVTEEERGPGGVEGLKEVDVEAKDEGAEGGKEKSEEEVEETGESQNVSGEDAVEQETKEEGSED